MDTFKDIGIKSDIKSAQILCVWVKIAKMLLAGLIVFIYFLFPEYITEVIVISLVFTLLLPLGFFDVFIQKLLEYNTHVGENRQVLNSTQANEQLQKIHIKLGE